MRLAGGMAYAQNYDVLFDGVTMTPHPLFLIEVADEEKGELECVVCEPGPDGIKRVKLGADGRPVRCTLRGRVQLRRKPQS